jgi:spermidine/putrescine transport system permease protein
VRLNSSRTIITAFLLFTFLYAPIATVVAFSFNDSRFSSNWEGFTTKWYATLFQNTVALQAIKNTLLLAFTSTSISTVLGSMLGYSLSRFRFFGKGWVEKGLYLPIFIPDIVMAIALLLFYSLIRSWLNIFQLGMITMIFAHVTFQIPFVAIVVRARLADFDLSLEEAARDLGATPWKTFRHVTLPLLWPGILAGAMLAFTLSLDDFVVSFFTNGPGATTLPIYIYSSVKRGITPEVNALSTLIVLASILGTISVTLLQRRNLKNNEI